MSTVILTEVKHTLRALRRDLQFAVVAALCLGLGVAVNLSLFALVNGVLLKPVNIGSMDRVVSVFSYAGNGPATSGPLSYKHLAAIRDECTVCETVSGYLEFSEAVTVSGTAMVVAGEFVAEDYFRTFAVVPVLGRLLGPTDDDGTAQGDGVLISELFWKKAFGRNPAAVGSTIRLRDVAVTIVGVLPDDFRGLNLPSLIPTQMWVPFRLAGRISSIEAIRSGNVLTDPNRRSIWGLVQLRSGRSIDEFQQQLQIFSTTNALQPPRRFFARPINGAPLKPSMSQLALPFGLSLMSLAIAVVVIAAASVTTLLAARAISREHEFMTRVAVGGSRMTIVRLNLIDSFILTGIAAGIGILFSYVTIRGVGRFNLPFAGIDALQIDLTPDWRVLLFGFSVTIITGLLVGVIPALVAVRRLRVSAVGRPSLPRPAIRASRVLIGLLVIEVGLSAAMLLVGALFVRTNVSLRFRDVGLAADDVVSLSMNLDLHGYSEERGRAFYRRLLGQARALESVRQVSMVDHLPIGSRNNPAQVIIDGRQPEANDIRRLASYARVGADYFDIVGTPIVRGRPITGEDIQGSSGIVVVSQLAARRFWNGMDPIGRYLQLGPNGRVLRVVGIARDTDVRFPGERWLPFLYVPYEQEYSGEMQLLLKADGEPNPLKERLAALLREVDANVAVVSIATVREYLDVWRLPSFLGSVLLTVFGVMGLVIAMIGVYGISAFAARQRIREAGIRIAMGATPRAVCIRIGIRALVTATVGLLIGVSAAVVISKILSSLLFGLAAFDLMTVATVTSCTFVVIAFGCYLPVWHLVHQDPARALREL